jgi:hypothetical protein
LNELLKELPQGAGLGGLILVALVSLAVYMPKLLNQFKSDRFDGNLMTRLDEMDKKIHKTNVKVTRLVVLIIRLEALLLANGVSIPADLQAEMAEMTKEDE